MKITVKQLRDMIKEAVVELGPNEGQLYRFEQEVMDLQHRIESLKQTEETIRGEAPQARQAIRQLISNMTQQVQDLQSVITSIKAQKK